MRESCVAVHTYSVSNRVGIERSFGLQSTLVSLRFDLKGEKDSQEPYCRRTKQLCQASDGLVCHNDISRLPSAPFHLPHHTSFGVIYPGVAYGYICLYFVWEKVGDDIISKESGPCVDKSGIQDIRRGEFEDHEW